MHDTVQTHDARYQWNSIESGEGMRIFKWLIVIFSVFLLMGLLLVSSQTTPVIAQVSPTETPTPNSTIVALEERVKTLEADVKLLNDRKDLESETLKLQTEKQLLPIYIGGVILGALGLSTTIGSWLAYKNFTERTRKELEEKTRKTLDKAFYNADPLYFPLYVPNQGFETEIKRLQKLGFKDLRRYGGLSQGILNGVIVFRVPGENFRENREEQTFAESALNTLQDFIAEHKADEKNAAFVLYITGGNLPKASELAAKYDNVVIANMPVTVAGHVYALVRGLTTIDDKKEDV